MFCMLLLFLPEQCTRRWYRQVTSGCRKHNHQCQILHYVVQLLKCKHEWWSEDLMLCLTESSSCYTKTWSIIKLVCKTKSTECKIISSDSPTVQQQVKHQLPSRRSGEVKAYCLWWFHLQLCSFMECLHSAATLNSSVRSSAHIIDALEVKCLCYTASQLVPPELCLVLLVSAFLLGRFYS